MPLSYTALTLLADYQNFNTQPILANILEYRVFSTVISISSIGKLVSFVTN
jgi:hypothetical protein